MGNHGMPRNGFIDITRLMFAVVIMLFHFYSDGEKHFPGGFLGVEYFMILSGFLFFAAYDQKHIAQLPAQKRGDYYMSYIKKRWSRFFGYAFLPFVAAFVIGRIWRGEPGDAMGIIDYLSGDIWDMLLVKMSGINRGTSMLNSPTWTLSCLLIVEFFVLGMLSFWERPFLTFLMPCSVVFGVGYWMNLEIINYRVFLTLFTRGTLRVYLLTCFGIFSYWISQELRRYSFSNIGHWVLTALEIVGYTMCLLICLFRSDRNYWLCFISIVTIILAISFSGKSFAGSMLPANGFTNFCAELSLSLYLTHRPMLIIFQHFFKDVNDLYRQKFVFLYCALAVALAYTYIMRGVFKMLPIVKEKLKSVLLEQS